MLISAYLHNFLLHYFSLLVSCVSCCKELKSTVACLKRCQGRNLPKDKSPEWEREMSTDGRNLQQEGADSRPGGSKTWLARPG